MRRGIDELNNIPKESDISREQEFHEPPDEFNRFAPTEEPTEKKTSSISKIMLYLATIGVVTLGLITPAVQLKPDEKTSVAIAEETPVPTVAQTPVQTLVPAPGPEETDTPAPTSTPTPMPTPTPTPTPVPPLTGQIHIIVYSDFLDWDSINQGLGANGICDKVTMDAEELTRTGYKLPPFPERKGYHALGYVLLGTPSDPYLIDLYVHGGNPHPLHTVALGDTLTAEDVRFIPEIDGVREAEIHISWLRDGSNLDLIFYDGEELFGEYSVGFSLQSDQLCYLDAFPKPEREGKTFVGWCNTEGELIDAVTFSDFFEKKPDARTYEDRDFSSSIPCRVYACWADGGGSPRFGWYDRTPINPRIVPEPTLAGRIHVIVYSDLYDENADNAYHSGVLADELFKKEDFKGYKLVQPPKQDGCQCIGFVLVTEGSAGYMYELNTPGTVPHPIGAVALGNMLRPEDLARLKPNEEGIYEVEIHAVWIADTSRYHIIFCDGWKQIQDYYVVLPLQKTGLLYLDAFPKPTKQGKTFAGWCDESGNQIDAVAYADFFRKIRGAQPPNDRDWNAPCDCKVYALWSDGSGGVPVPTPRPTYYQVKASSPCGFSEGDTRGGTRLVEKGSYVTIYMKMTDDFDYYECNFSVTDPSGTTEYCVEPYKTVRHDTDTDPYYDMYFMIRIKITGDTYVSFFA